jgi:hypothetical protein
MLCTPAVSHRQEDIHKPDQLSLSWIWFSLRIWCAGSTEQLVFIVETCVGKLSYGICHCKFCEEFPGGNVPTKSMIERLVRKIYSAGSWLNKKKNRKWSILTDERLNETWVFLRNMCNEIFVQLAAQCGMSVGSAHKAVRLLRLRLHKRMSIQRLSNPDSGTCFCSWLLGSVHDWTVNPKVFSCNDEECLHLGSFVNAWSNCCWRSENSH